MNETEIDARNELIKRLRHPLKLLVEASKKEKQKRAQAYQQTLGTYKTEKEAHEAYGYGFITSEEYDQICEIIEKGAEFVENNKSAIEYAEAILRDYVNKLKLEVASIASDALPHEAQELICKSNEELYRTTEACKRNNYYTEVDE